MRRPMDAEFESISLEMYPVTWSTNIISGRPKNANYHMFSIIFHSSAEDCESMNPAIQTGLAKSTRWMTGLRAMNIVSIVSSYMIFMSSVTTASFNLCGFLGVLLHKSHSLDILSIARLVFEAIVLPFKRLKTDFVAHTDEFQKSRSSIFHYCSVYKTKFTSDGSYVYIRK